MLRDSPDLKLNKVAKAIVVRERYAVRCEGSNPSFPTTCPDGGMVDTKDLGRNDNCY